MMFKNLFLKNRGIKKRGWIITIFAFLFAIERVFAAEKWDGLQCTPVLQDQSVAYAKQLIQNSKTRYFQLNTSSHSHEFSFATRLILARAQRTRSGNFSIVIVPRQPDLDRFSKYLLGSHPSEFSTHILNINRIQRERIQNDSIKSLDQILSAISHLDQVGHPLLIGTQENFRILINALGHGDRSLQPSSKGLLLALNKLTSRVSTLIDFSWEEQAIPQIDRLIHVGLRKWPHLAALRINIGGRLPLREMPLPALVAKKYSAIDDPDRIQDFSEWILATPLNQLLVGINNSKNPFGTWFYRFYRMRQTSAGSVKAWWEYFEVPVLQKIYDTEKFYLPEKIAAPLRLSKKTGKSEPKPPKSGPPHLPTVEEFEEWVLSLSILQLEKDELKNDPWFRRWFAKHRRQYSIDKPGAPAWWNQFKNAETLRRIYQTGQVIIPDEIIEERDLLQRPRPQEDWWVQFRQLERFVLLADKLTLEKPFENSPHEILRWFANVLKKSHYESGMAKARASLGGSAENLDDPASLGWWAYLSDQCIARLVIVAHVKPPPEVINYLAQKGFLGNEPIPAHDEDEAQAELVLRKLHPENQVSGNQDSNNEIHFFQIADTQEKIRFFSNRVRELPPLILREQVSGMKNFYRTWFYNLRYRYDGSPSAKGRAWWSMFDDDVLIKLYQTEKIPLPEQELIRLGLKK